MDEHNPDSTAEAESNSTDDRRPGPTRVPIGLVMLWCAVVAIAGGYACSHALASFAIIGSFSFLLLGVVAGWTARVVIGTTGIWPAASLTIACLVACAIALVFRFRITDPTMSWRDSLRWLGPSLASDKVFATFAIGCAVVGGLLASFFVLRKKTTP